MPVDLIVLYRPPADPAAFEHHYRTVHVPLVHAMPHLARRSRPRPAPVETADGDPVHFVARLRFARTADLDASMASPEGAAALADLANFSMAGSVVVTAEWPRPERRPSTIRPWRSGPRRSRSTASTASTASRRSGGARRASTGWSALGDADGRGLDLVRRGRSPRCATGSSTRSPAAASGCWPSDALRRAARRWPTMAASVASGASRCGQWPMPGSSIVVSGCAKCVVQAGEQRRADAAVVGAVDDQRRRLRRRRTRRRRRRCPCGSSDETAAATSGRVSMASTSGQSARCRPGDQSLAAAVMNSGSPAISARADAYARIHAYAPGLLLAQHAAADREAGVVADGERGQRGEPAGVLGAQPVADDAAPVVADHVRAVDAEVVEQARPCRAPRPPSTGRRRRARRTARSRAARARSRGSRSRRAPPPGSACRSRGRGSRAARARPGPSPNVQTARSPRPSVTICGSLMSVLRSPATTSGTTMSGRSRCGQWPTVLDRVLVQRLRRTSSSRPPNSAGRMHCDCVP